MTLNAIGAVATGLVLVIVTVTKFTHGAWIVIAAMPVIITFFIGVNRHYGRIARALAVESEPPRRGEDNTFVLLIRDLGAATTKAVGYLRALRPDHVVALYVGDPGSFESVAERWAGFAPRMGSLQQLQTGGDRQSKALRARLRSSGPDPADSSRSSFPKSSRAGRSCGTSASVGGSGSRSPCSSRETSS